ncbi:MAG: efflux RND transporter periplasmic adaptor subunit [Reinekea forsetii]|nr:efflux RND transporter periplasmic adaptor subunit [Reinekea forsetii]
MKKLFVVLIIVAAIVALSLYQARTGKPEQVRVQVFEVVEQPIESTVLATGTLTYGDERRVRSEVDARVIAVAVEEGDRVSKGQVLVRLDRQNFETDVSNQQTNVALRRIDIERAQLRIESLTIQLARQLKLFQQNAAQATVIEDLKNQIAQANVDLKMQNQLLVQSQDHLGQAQKRLAKTVISAPVSGLVSALDIKEGEMAVGSAADVPLLTLVDPEQIYSEVDVDEADIGNVQLGLPVRVFAVAYLDTALTGTVTKIATSARQVPGKNSLVFPVEVAMADQELVVLRPGMSTRAEVLNRSNISYPVIPIEALQDNAADDDPGYHVFVARAGIAVKVSVTLGPQDDRYQALTSGIETGDEVISGPYRLVRSLNDGDAIILEPTSLDTTDDTLSTD